MRTRSRAAVAFLVALWGWGCAVYQPVTPIPTSGDLPRNVRITRRDGSMVTLAVAQVAGDTIRGFRPNSTLRVHIPVTDVAQIAVPRIDKKESALALVGVAGLALVMTLWVRQRPQDGPMP